MGCGLSNPEKKIISKKIDKMEQRVKKRKEIEKLIKIKDKKINNLKQLQKEGKGSKKDENKIKTNKAIRKRGRSASAKTYENKLRGKAKRKTNIIPNVNIRKNFIIMGKKKRPGSEYLKKVRKQK